MGLLLEIAWDRRPYLGSLGVESQFDKSFGSEERSVFSYSQQGLARC